jgi:hypothetical protein
MRTRLLVVLILAAACARKSAAPTRTDSRAAPPPIATVAPSPGPGDPEPQDLEPVETRKSYGARDPDPLLKDVDAEFSMVSMPSFSPAYAVALVGDESEPRRWTIRFAADPLTEHRHLAKGEDPQRSASAGLDEKSALQLREAWESVVRRARYPRPRYVEDPDGQRWESHRLGFDGTTYRFESGEYCGTTWEPKAELTWGIVELGDALRKYALLDEAARPAQLARCLELARKLQQSAEKRPW